MISVGVQLIEKPAQTGLNDKKLHNLTQWEPIARLVSRHGGFRSLAPFL